MRLLPFLGLVASLAACGTVHPTAEDLLSDPAATLRAPNSTVIQTYATNGHTNVVSSDRSTVTLAQTATSSPAAVSDFYDSSLRTLGWTRDCRAALSLSTDGPNTAYGWSKGTQQLSLTVDIPSVASRQVSFKVSIRVAPAEQSAANIATGPLTAC